MQGNFTSLQDYLQQVHKGGIITTNLPIKLAENQSDFVFLDAIVAAENPLLPNNTIYIVSSALIKLSIYAKRYSLTKKLIPLALKALMEHTSGDELLEGIMTSILVPAIRVKNPSLIRFAIKSEEKILGEGRSGHGVDFYLDAARLDSKNDGIAATEALLSHNPPDHEQHIHIITLAALKASEENIKWQVEILVDAGARIDEIKETNIRKIFGSKKNAILSLPEKREHLFPKLLTRYLGQKANPPNPIEYMSICPDWQKGRVMEVIADL